MNLIEELENNRILMKNNMLVKARYSLSLVENRIFLYMLYKLQKKSDGILTCSINHFEFKEIVKFKQKNTVKGILDVLEELRKKPIYFKEEKKNKKGSIWGAYGFINGYEYDDELGIFNIEASEKIHDLLKEYLKMGYTPVNLQIWLSLSNSYAQRFYDLLRLWSGTKETVSYKVDEIKELLILEDKYDKYNDFKRRVILPAIKELNDTGCFEINIKENKVGRRVDSIDFIVKDLDSRIYFNKDSVDVVDTDELRQIKSTKPKQIDDYQKKNISLSDFYVPNKKLFTTKTLKDFTSDFSGYDFSDKKLKQILQESIMITLDQDDEEKIKVKSYNYFKGVLSNKLKKHKTMISDKNEFSPTFKTRFHNHKQTFTRYDPDELEQILFESQKDKFK